MVSQAARSDDAAKPATDAGARQREKQLERLIKRLPRKLQATVRWLRHPSSRWVRLAGGIVFIAGAFLSILPVFGLWMLPVGLALLAEDIPLLRRARDRLLDWIERHRPHWITGGDAEDRA